MVADGRGGLVHLSVGPYKRQWAPRGAALPCWTTSRFAPFATLHAECLSMAWRRANCRSAAVTRGNASAVSALRVQWAGDCVGLVPPLRGGAPSGRRHCRRQRLTIAQALYMGACAIGSAASALDPTTIDRVPGAVRVDTSSLYGRPRLPRTTMASSPPPPPSWLGLGRPARKCIFCPLGISSALSPQRHMMAIHASDNPLLPRTPQSQRAPSSGASAFCPAPTVAVAGTLDGGPDHADGSTHAPTSAGGACADARTTPSPGPAPSVSFAAAALAGTGLAATAAAAAFVNQSAENAVSRERNDGVARGRIAGPRPPAGAIRNVFATCVAARVRGYYDAFPEASLSTPAVSPLFAQGSSRFRGPVLRAILKFSMGAGGTGLSRQDQMQFASLLHLVEGAAQGTDGADFSREFVTASSFVTAVRGEQNRIIANLKWMQVPIQVGGKTYTFYHRDLLDAAVSAVRSSTTLDLDGGPLPPADDGSPRRSSTLDADMFLQEVLTV